MPFGDRPNSDIGAIADGMIDLLKKNLIATTVLVQDAHVGDTVIYVDNNLRFDRNDNVAILDNLAEYNPDQNSFSGIEYHTIKDYIVETNKIVLVEPLQKNFLVSDNGRMQKTIKKAILFPKDVLYGDRAVLAFDQVAITVDSESFTTEWKALRVMSDEFRLAINIYTKTGGGQDEEEYNLRIRDAYANAIYNLCANNVHLDVAIDDVLLKKDAIAGTNYVYIPINEAANWPEDSCLNYEVQDNFGTNQDMWIIDCDASSSSVSSWSSDSTSLSVSSGSSSFSTNSSSNSSSNDSSSNTSMSHSSESTNSSSLSSLSSESLSSASSRSSGSSSTVSESFSSMTTGSSSTEVVNHSSSSSTSDDFTYKVCLSHNLTKNYLMKDKAVLRRIIRYLYDSRASNIEYGVIQKGSALLKAARITWWGKETREFSFPQVGKGGTTK